MITKRTRVSKIAQRKERLIRRITYNETYTQESDMVVRLSAALAKMSFDDLDALMMVIAQKERWAAENHVRWED